MVSSTFQQCTSWYFCHACPTSWNFGEQNKPGQDEDKLCRIANASRELEKEVSFHTWVHRVFQETPQACAYKVQNSVISGSDLPGGPVDVSGGSADEMDAECCNACQDKTDCQFWVRYTTYCFVKKQRSGTPIQLRVEQSYTVGFKVEVER